jgi:hypothetical protein
MPNHAEHIAALASDRWSAGKLLAGVACCMCLGKAILALSLVTGIASTLHAFPRLSAAPAEGLVRYALLVVVFALLFRHLDRRQIGA